MKKEGRELENGSGKGGGEDPHQVWKRRRLYDVACVWIDIRWSVHAGLVHRLSSWIHRLEEISQRTAASGALWRMNWLFARQWVYRRRYIMPHPTVSNGWNSIWLFYVPIPRTSTVVNNWLFAIFSCVMCVSALVCIFFEFLKIVMEPLGAFRLLAKPHAATRGLVLLQVNRDNIFLVKVMHNNKRLIQVYVT